jgi:myo-inositol-1(or 4)-monophosphatase
MSAPSATITVMLRAAEKAAKSLLRDFGEVENLQVSRKGPANFVSAADLRAEEIIYQDLHKSRPSFGFLMEERGEVKGVNEKGAEEFRFIVDPLDGTTNFLHGIPHFNISIALERGTGKSREIIAGLVHDPIKNETFYAEKGTGAWLDKRRLRVSARKEMALSIIAGGDAASKGKTEQNRFLKNINALTGHTSGFRRMGCAALDLCYVAAGRFEGFFESGLKPWDIAAGALIVKEAGGQIISLEGDDNPVYADSILASNIGIHQDLKKIIQESLK